MTYTLRLGEEDLNQQRLRHQEDVITRTGIMAGIIAASIIATIVTLGAAAPVVAVGNAIMAGGSAAVGTLSVIDHTRGED